MCQLSQGQGQAAVDIRICAFHCSWHNRYHSLLSPSLYKAPQVPSFSFSNQQLSTVLLGRHITTSEDRPFKTFTNCPRPPPHRNPPHRTFLAVSAVGDPLHAGKTPNRTSTETRPKSNAFGRQRFRRPPPRRKTPSPPPNARSPCGRRISRVLALKRQRRSLVYSVMWSFL